jgi:hypothetical protein
MGRRWKCARGCRVEGDSLRQGPANLWNRLNFNVVIAIKRLIVLVIVRSVHRSAHGGEQRIKTRLRARKGLARATLLAGPGK